MNGYIYRYTYLPTGKIYVGQHISDKFDENYYGSGVLWLKVIKNADRSLIKREVLEWCLNTSKEELTERENYWIHCLNSLDESIGYNLCEAQPNFWKGHTHSNVTKKVISKASVGRIFVYKNNTRKFIKKSELDKFISDGYSLGTGLHNKHTEESKQMISEKNRDKIRLTDGKVNIFISKNQEDEFLSKGFFPGKTENGIIKQTRYMTNGELEERVTFSRQQSKEESGWVFGTLSDYTDEELETINQNFLLIKEKRKIERIEKFKEVRKGHTVSEETREKLRRANTGKCVSDETRQKLRVSLKGKHRNFSQEGLNNIIESNKQRSITDQTRLKMSQSHLGSQSDHIWINNGEINKRVTEEDFMSNYLELGFQRGRCKLHDK